MMLQVDQVILGSTSLASPDLIYDHTFVRDILEGGGKGSAGLATSGGGPHVGPISPSFRSPGDIRGGISASSSF